MSSKVQFNLIKVINIFGIDFYNGAITVKDLIERFNVMGKKQKTNEQIETECEVLVKKRDNLAFLGEVSEDKDLNQYVFEDEFDGFGDGFEGLDDEFVDELDEGFQGGAKHGGAQPPEEVYRINTEQINDLNDLILELEMLKLYLCGLQLWDTDETKNYENAYIFVVVTIFMLKGKILI